MKIKTPKYKLKQIYTQKVHTIKPLISHETIIFNPTLAKLSGITQIFYVLFTT